MNKFKKILSFLLAFVIIFAGLPTFAADSQYNISDWAIWEMVEAERYGFYESEVYEKGFQDVVEKEVIENFLEKVENKLVKEGLKENKGVNLLDVKNNSKREDILKSLYNLYLKYDQNEVKKENYLEYMKENRVIFGDGDKLNLEKEATTQEAVLFIKRFINSFYNNNDLGSKGLMWEMNHNGNRVYFLGSIHLATSYIYPYNGLIMARFNEADKLFVEANILDPNITNITLDSLYYKDGTMLKDVIGDELYKDIKTYMDSLGVSEEVYKHLKPWAVTLQIQNLNFMSDATEQLSPIYGIDMYFILNAMKQGKEIVELEGAKYQYDVFDSMEVEKQKEILKDMLNSLGKEKVTEENKGLEEVLKMLEYWKSGDESLKELVTVSQESSDGFMDILLGDRDKKMAEKIDKLVNESTDKTYFIVVGAAHYLGDNTILDILKDKGYEIRSLNK